MKRSARWKKLLSSVLISLLRSAVSALVTFLGPSWDGPVKRYRPEDHYMRGPGPKWREKHVLDRASADAILRAQNLAAQETQKATVQLVDKSESTILWSGSANDRSMMMLDLKHGGEKKLADHLIGELKKAMQP